jgi:hypothetical protein
MNNTWTIPISIAFGVSWLALIVLNFVATEALKNKDKNEFEALGGKEGYFFLYIHPVWLLYMSYVYVLFGRYKYRELSREAISTFNAARVVAIANVMLGIGLLYLISK